MPKPTDLVQGTPDLLILRIISLEPEHGWAIVRRIQRVSQEALQIRQKFVYTAVHRAEWRPTETGRVAKFYSLTRSRRKQRERELATRSTATNIAVQEA
jgi:PadR family transcriptional regulator, regulatory protein PadR